MSLNDSLTAIADDMEKDSVEAENSDVVLRCLLRTYARSIRALAKNTDNPQAPFSSQKDADLFNLSQIEKARQEFRKKRPLPDDPGAEGQRVATCEDGPYANCVIEIHPSMKEGDTTSVSGHGYVLRAGRLHYVK